MFVAQLFLPPLDLPLEQRNLGADVEARLDRFLEFVD
jgi:hypothetical protein